MPNDDIIDMTTTEYGTFGSRTDVGYVREHNEDSLLVAPPLYVVCDGMGGHEAGEVASEIAIQTVANRAPEKPNAEALGQAVEEANLAVIQGARTGLGKEGVGTTCTAAMMEDGKLVIAQVDDSRAYLLHNGSLQQITRDHSVVADLVESGELAPDEARTHQWRSYITRALGLDPYMQADLYEIGVSSGDRLLLCSDGLYSMITDDVIAKIMESYADPQRVADALVEAALANGGTDNITVIVADAESSAKRTRKIARRAKITAALIIVLMVAIIGGTAVGASYWINNSAYLDAQAGRIIVYKGVPGDFLGMQLNELAQVTDVSIDELKAIQPGTAERIENGDVRCDSVEAALDLVNQYQQNIDEHNQQQKTEIEVEEEDDNDENTPFDKTEHQ